MRFKKLKKIPKKKYKKEEPIDSYRIVSKNYITGEDEVRIINKYKEVKNEINT